LLLNDLVLLLLDTSLWLYEFFNKLKVLTLSKLKKKEKVQKQNQ